MMDHGDENLLVEFIQSKLASLAVDDEQLLRDYLRQLEDGCRELEFKKDGQEDIRWPNGEEELMRKLWLHLIKVGIESENVQLCLILVAKLKLVQLALFLKEILHDSSAHGKTIALAYVADYFHVDNNNNISNNKYNDLITRQDRESCKLSGQKRKLLFAHEHLIQFNIQRANWRAALDLIDELMLDDSQNVLWKQLLHNRYAQDLELDENFEEAVKNYVQSGTERQNVPRIIIKQFMDLAGRKLRNYCNNSSSNSMKIFWLKYSIQIGARDISIDQLKIGNDFGDDDDDSNSSLFNSELIKRLSLVGGGSEEVVWRRIVDLLPKTLANFINDTKPDKWITTSSDRRKFESLIRNGSGLNSSVRRVLAELSARYKQQQLTNNNNPSKVCELYLCLNQTETVAHLAPTFLDSISSVCVAYQLVGSMANNNSDILANNLIDHMDRRCNQKNLGGRPGGRNNTKNYNHLRGGHGKNSKTIFLAYIKLGLMDESLQVLAKTLESHKDEQSTICQAPIEMLQNVIKLSQTSGMLCLDKVDPEIGSQTLVRLQESLLINASPETNAQIITVIILSIHVFLLKLHNPANNNNNPSPSPKLVGGSQSISKLEIMFKRLAELYLDSSTSSSSPSSPSSPSVALNFDASDTLVRATNNLVGAVKLRLDALADSDAIRSNFRKLVETIAGNCMIESRYKSAAALYSQIEDNISAVKSLMRMGDVDIVLDYSLLVRDITVNRLTINYLKHLNVEAEVIEEFITKSKL